MKTKKYGLRIKDSDHLLQYKVIEIKGKEENNVVYILEKEGEQDWLLDSVEEVNEALKKNTTWYNSDKKTPYITLSKEQLEIVEVSEIKRIEPYSSRSIYEDLDSYHRQKVEEALKQHANETEKKIIQSLPEEQIEPAEEVMEFFAPATKEENRITTTQERKTIKAKVKCIKDIPKELGSVRLKSAPISLCFKDGKHYMAYIKQEKLFIMNEDKVPEFICNAPSEESWEQNIFFEKHFVVEEYLD